MRERPILFSSPMVRAILEGRKTQTRRVVKPIPQMVSEKNIVTWDGDAAALMRLFDQVGRSCPYGNSGDRLWVREAFAIVPRTAYRCSEGVQQTLRPGYDHDAAIYREGWTRSNGGFRWRPSIHMPRWASRILLEITAVRVERLADISKDDAMAEGIVIQPDGGFGLADSTHYHFSDPTDSYCSLWESINGAGSWMTNPFVWVIEFKRVTP